MIERTLLLIKPDAVNKGAVEEIMDIISKSGLKIKKTLKRRLSKKEAQRFYKVHRGKSFFRELIEFITSGEVVGVLIEGEGAVDRLRRLAGATDPKEAVQGTIRHLFGTSITRNAVHASDSISSANYEISLFFKKESSY